MIYVNVHSNVPGVVRSMPLGTAIKQKETLLTRDGKMLISIQEEIEYVASLIENPCLGFVLACLYAKIWYAADIHGLLEELVYDCE